MPINEVHSLAQQLYETAGILVIVENLAVDLCLVEPIPACAEYAVLAQYGLVGEENSCIGKGSVPKVGVSIRFWRAGEACPRKTDIV
ncbi:hypothetical protein [Eggerthella lenta]|uniref:hypothetical protein n=1 Tax=Eggerthella lenta TaxID=84112 RepID=UPI0012E008AE|nr:hypothetical protein [Eggerthella lenta]